MLRIGSSAPAFSCEAVQPDGIVELQWEQIHGEAILVLIFDSLSRDDDVLRDLTAIARRACEFRRFGANVAIVCRNEAYEVAKTLARLGDDCDLAAGGLILLDPGGDIVSQFEMDCIDGGTMWGHCIIDPYGLIRQFSQSDVRVGIDVDELIRCIEAIARPHAEWPC